MTPLLFRASTIVSLCLGENLANTEQRDATIATCNSDRLERASPRQHKPCEGAAAKGFTLLPDRQTATHRWPSRPTFGHPPECPPTLGDVRRGQHVVSCNNNTFVAGRLEVLDDVSGTGLERRGQAQEARKIRSASAVERSVLFQS